MHNVFKTYHPAVAFCYLACVLVFTMTAIHPVYGALSLAGAFACSIITRGLRTTIGSLRWIIPLCLIVTIVNPLFSASGSTKLFQIGVMVIYSESLAYGACAGMMFAATFLWFSSYANCMTSENTMALFGNVLPIVSLMVSQVLRLVPQFVNRGRAIASAQDAQEAAAPTNKKQQLQSRFRIVSVLFGWGMEDGLDRSDAMRARGYGATRHRTTYQRFHFSRIDMLVVAIVIILSATNGILMYMACSQFAFYPTVPELALWWGYLPHVALMVFPLALQFVEWWQWRSLE